MKKQLFLLTIAALALFSCHRAKQHPRIVKWDDYKKAYRFLSLNRDSAFYYFNKLTGNSRDSLQIAMAYNNMAAIQSDAGDDFGAQESLTLSLRYLDENNSHDRSCLANDYNELGMTSFNLKSYDQAIGFYTRSSSFTDDPSFLPTILNNQANAYQRKKDYTRALKLYRKVIGLTGTTGSVYARLLTNMATTKWLANTRYNAAPDLLIALNIRKDEKDLWGENSSYAHLSDFYSCSKPDSALLYAGYMYAVTLQLNSPDDQLEALQKLIGLSSPAVTKRYFARYQQLADSVQAARSAAKNQFALIRYDAEKSKADNLKLQKDNTEERYQITKQRFLLICSVLTLLAGSIFAVFWYRKRKQRMELEARERELRISQKVHDVVANGLYRLMTEIEHGAKIIKDHLLNQLEHLYEQSRDISYENVDTGNINFSDKISMLLTDFAAPTLKVAVVGNALDVWENVSMQTRQEVVPILQELMVNMKKHSRATRVAILFSQENEFFHIDYTDNGIGISSDVSFGNGLTSTGNRIKGIGGTITFDTQKEKGTKINLSFPLLK